MARPSKAKRLELPSEGVISFSTDKIEACYEVEIDNNGRFSRFGPYAGYKAVLLIKKH